MRLSPLAVGLGIALGGLAGFEAEARACGGCIHPNETPTVVTDHRMIFSISTTQTTLYDQIEYTGTPSSFGWVLPFAGDITVGVSSDTLFGALDSQTATQIYAPALNCPAPPSSCQRGGADGGAFSPTAGHGVDVLKREVVGPYDTAQLKATDVNALDDWAAKNGFVIPDAVKPTIAAYQSEHFNFLAVKLVPGKGVQDMRPIRVTTQGSSVALPLRMVSAGTGATVGITLWVVAEGRYEPANFGAFAITTDELAWDWTNNKSNYTDLRAQKTAAGNGRVWEIESSPQIARDTITSLVRSNGSPFGFPSGVDAGTDDSGYEAAGDKTAAQVRDDDLTTLFAGIPSGAERITRLRADLAHSALDADLVLRATADQSIFSNVRNVTRELNEPLCPIYNECDPIGTAPRSQAAAKTAENNDSSGCAVRNPDPASAWFAVAFAFFGISLGRKIRRR